MQEPSKISWIQVASTTLANDPLISDPRLGGRTFRWDYNADSLKGTTLSSVTYLVVKYDHVCPQFQVLQHRKWVGGGDN